MVVEGDGLLGEIIISKPLRDRRGEISQLGKFYNIHKIREIIGQSGCFLKTENSNGTKTYQIYEIKDSITNPWDLKGVLAAAVPINFFASANSESVNPDTLTDGLEIIEKCLEKSIPLFMISQNNCQLYHIRKEKNSTRIIYDCPDIHSAGNFNCRAHKNQFCKWISSDQNNDWINSILTKFKKYTGHTNIPIFEFSTFINYCIASYYFQSWGKHTKAIDAEKKNMRNALKASVSSELNQMDSDIIKKILQGVKKKGEDS